jgi:hypothetical protein
MRKSKPRHRRKGVSSHDRRTLLQEALSARELTPRPAASAPGFTCGGCPSDGGRGGLFFPWRAENWPGSRCIPWGQFHHPKRRGFLRRKPEVDYDAWISLQGPSGPRLLAGVGWRLASAGRWASTDLIQSASPFRGLDDRAQRRHARHPPGTAGVSWTRSGSPRRSIPRFRTARTTSAIRCQTFPCLQKGFIFANMSGLPGSTGWSPPGVNGCFGLWSRRSDRRPRV